MVDVLPEKIVAQYLVNNNLGKAPAVGVIVPGFVVFVNALPDTPDKVISVSSNGLSRNLQKDMHGNPFASPGIQVRVRSLDHNEASEKAIEIYNNISNVAGTELVVLTQNYRIVNMSLSSFPYFIGHGKDDQRVNFVFDMFLTYRKVS